MDQAAFNPTLGLGLTLATTGGWFGQVWLSAKLIFVVVLSGIHGVQSGQLRRMAGGGPSSVTKLRTAPLILASLVAIAILAVVKPG